MTWLLAEAHGASPVVLSVGAERRDPLASGTVGTLTWVPPGTLRMGSPAPGGWTGPPSTAKLKSGFWTMETEVTQAMWHAVTGENPSTYADGPSFPVDSVSWCEAVWFANAVSAREGLPPAYTLPEGFAARMTDAACTASAPGVVWNATAPGYRLPTEAEWEWAARGGEEHVYAGSDDAAAVAQAARPGAWSNEHRTRAVRLLAPNAFGLYDTTGNVWEWCWTPFEGDPAGPPPARAGESRVVRGGSASDAPGSVPVSARAAMMAGTHEDFAGFRLIRSGV